TGAGQACTERIVRVRIGYRASRAGEKTDAAVGVISVEAGGTGVALRLVLADALHAVGIGLAHAAAQKFIHNLRKAGGVHVIHQILRGDSVGALSHTVAVTVIQQAYSAVLDQMIFKVVCIASATREDGVAIGVVAVRCQAIVRIIGKRTAGNKRQRGVQLGTVPDWVVGVVHFAIVAAGIAADGLGKQTIGIVVCIVHCAPAQLSYGATMAFRIQRVIEAGERRSSDGADLLDAVQGVIDGCDLNPIGIGIAG